MTKFLLDTNVLLWYFWDKERISSIKELIVSEDTEIFISSVSIWEVLIKTRKGKLDIDVDKMQFFIKKCGFLELPLDSSYAEAYLNLPHIHGDPYDHMLLAQAITCPMRFITGDELLAEYSSLVMVV